MLIGFEMAPEMKGCAAASMWMWLSGQLHRLPQLAARARAVEHREMLGLQAWRAFERHACRRHTRSRPRSRSFEKPMCREQVEALRVHASGVELRARLAELLAEHPLVEHELDVEGAGKRRLDAGDFFGVKPFAAQRLWLTCGASASVPRPTAVGDDGPIVSSHSRGSGAPRARRG